MKLPLALVTALLACTAALTGCTTAPMQDAGMTGPLMIAKQGSFFVGGRDAYSENLSTLPIYAAKGTITLDQMYVHYQVPVNARQVPITLIHGCCLTGTTWETTPDGRMGWDEFFVRQGHPTYLIDQVARGRSAANATAFNAAKTGAGAPAALPTVFAAGHEGAWAIFRFGSEFPKVHPGMQFPLEAQGEFWKQMVPDWSASLPSPNPTVPALSQLAMRLQGTVLMSHSQSGIYPFQAAALTPQGIAAIVAIEPADCPAPDGDLKPYLGMPILVLFGDYVDLAPRWAPRLKKCRAFVAAANQAGGRAEIIVLPERGIKGNSHMIMQDRNSLQVAALLDTWLREHVRPQP